MKVFLGADHQGYSLKQDLKLYLESRGHQVEDDGNARLDPDDDFPVFAARVVNALLGSDEKNPMGILICGSGQGMAMAANRHRGIRAAVVWDEEEARVSRNDDDSNVLALPARLLKNEKQKAFDIVDVWLKTSFESIPRRNRRIKEMDEI